MSKKSRSKSKASKQSGAKKLNPVILIVALVVVGAALFIFLRPAPVAEGVADFTDEELVSNADPLVISPQIYNDRFVSSGVDYYLLDVRTPAEYASGQIAGADNISVETLQSRLSELPTDKPIVLYCRSGNRSAQAASILKQAGFTGVYDLGGITSWQSAGNPICTNC
ncbi:MAG: rhodanese-like domain-containing protein [Anaerolineae bacterium]|nr:rhodanese-like domain-containing protein [Anaerolineae bacterium]MCA9890811.1 rhodanese-like domain-containing protein [Anaerolineae bacterium]